MNTQAVFLFPPSSRRSDPITSHLAEAEVTGSGERARQAAEVLRGVLAHPGGTSAEVAAGDFRGMITARRRLPELERAGQIRRGEPRRCSITGRMSLTWWPT